MLCWENRLSTRMASAVPHPHTREIAQLHESRPATIPVYGPILLLTPDRPMDRSTRKGAQQAMSYYRKFGVKLGVRVQS